MKADTFDKIKAVYNAVEKYRITSRLTPAMCQLKSKQRWQIIILDNDTRAMCCLAKREALQQERFLYWGTIDKIRTPAPYEDPESDDFNPDFEWHEHVFLFAEVSKIRNENQIVNFYPPMPSMSELMQEMQDVVLQKKGSYKNCDFSLALKNLRERGCDHHLNNRHCSEYHPAYKKWLQR